MYTLTLTTEQLQILDKAIAELPFKIAAPLVADINNQMRMQQEKEAAKLEDERNRNKP